MIPVQRGETLIHDAARGHWLHFRNPLALFSTEVHSEIPSIIRELDERVCNEKLYAAGYITYDAAPAFDKALPALQEAKRPLLSFSLYEAPQIIKELHYENYSNEKQELNWAPCINRDEYNSGFSAIKDYIQRGHSYQVNYTYRLKSDFSGDPWNLFCRMQKAQNASYGAYLDCSDTVISSASPELFFSLDGDKIRTKPMKGTAPRGMTAKEDRKEADELYNSEKNRAENMMIVDMIRNDLGRIARRGSVRVPRLFELEKYPTLWQMTTEVLAETDAGIPEILENLFPCASITGAPKYRTMEIIKELESSPRGIYTGSIGYWGPGRIAQFNVAIRTAVISRNEGTARYGTGGGIIWDSSQDGEYEESLTKTAILKQKVSDFSLLETIKWSEEGGYYLLERHLTRLEESAGYFDFIFNRDIIMSELNKAAKGLKTDDKRIRLLLSKTGEIRIETYPLGLTESKKPRTITKAPRAIPEGDPFLYHKTTMRDLYNSFLEDEADCEDVLLWNKKGEITESCIANFVAVINGEHFTPPIACGLLGGTLRSEMIENGKLREKVIKLDELENAEEIYLINSLRGKIPVDYRN
jgi:para-aminobenzoate synthetase / 4-amino-4-deoxychorismate lyase